MHNKKETRPTVGAAGRAKTGDDFAGHIPETDCITATPPCRARITDYLHHGQANAVTLRHLERLTNLSGREVRRMIEAERRAGALIISDNQHGYYLTDDPGEAQRFARSMRHRAREILRTARAIEGAAGFD